MDNGEVGIGKEMAIRIVRRSEIAFMGMSKTRMRGNTTLNEKRKREREKERARDRQRFILEHCVCHSRWLVMANCCPDHHKLLLHPGYTHNFCTYTDHIYITVRFVSNIVCSTNWYYCISLQ